MAGYMKLSLAVVLVAFVGACVASDPFDIAGYKQVVNAVWGNETLPYETNLEKLAYLKDVLENKGIILLLQREHHDIYFRAVFYLAGCVKDHPDSDFLEFLGDGAMDEMIQDERNKSNSANIISFLEECKQKLH